MHVIEKIMAKAAGWKPVEIRKIIMVSVDFADFDTLIPDSMFIFWVFLDSYSYR
jgi:hypothetical protein